MKKAFMVLVMIVTFLWFADIVQAAGVKKKSDPNTDTATQTDPSKIIRRQHDPVAEAVIAFNKSPQVAAAKKAIADSQAEYDAARKNTLAALAPTPNYRAAIQIRDAARSRVIELKRTPTAVPGALADALAAENIAVSAVQKLETDAYAADPKVQKAEARVGQAQKAWVELRERFYRSIDYNPLDPQL